MVIDITLILASPTQNCGYSYRKFASGDDTLLYNILSSYDWSCVYDTSSVYAAVARLSVVVQDAMEQAIPRGFTCNFKFPYWFSGSLKYYIKKKNYFYRGFKKHKSGSLHDQLSFYRKLVKSTIEVDRLRWFYVML
jgi:hypothetical protein